MLAVAAVGCLGLVFWLLKLAIIALVVYGLYMWIT